MAGLMDYKIKNGKVILAADDFEPSLVFDCGQCFRWEENGRAWRGVAMGYATTVERQGNEISVDCSEEDFQETWLNYFDLSYDYATARERISTDPFTAAAAEYGRGIRILRQDFWEALCSFIISQCNNISRITGIISRLCEMYGAPFEYKGKTFYAFPSAERLAAVSSDDLAPLRAGYRAKYIVDAARDVAKGRISAEEIRPLSTKDAIARLCELNGVGVKVASCTLLFGCGKRDAFPIDVWMKRALNEHYQKGFDGSAFGMDAGVAQQYIFHYIRNYRNSNK